MQRLSRHGDCRLLWASTHGLHARPAHNTVLWAGLACSPCVDAHNNRQSPCRDNRCMQAITVEEVFARTCEIYEGRLRPGAGPAALAAGSNGRVSSGKGIAVPERPSPPRV